MRQRTTFFQQPFSATDPAQLRLVGETLTLTGPALDKAAREDRLTLALEEVPPELGRILGAGVHELHVRWASPRPAESVSPLFARLPPGLHVFYTPQSAATTSQHDDAICTLLQKLFDQSLDCKSPSLSFTALGGGDRFSHSAAFQYYAALDSLAGFAKYVRAEWCPRAGGCALDADQLDSASSLELTYDAISHTVRLTTLQPPLAQRPLHVAARLPDARTEVGILAADAPPTLGPHELAMAGHVAVLGQDTQPSPVMFAFPSRHRQAVLSTGKSKAAAAATAAVNPSHFSVAVLQPTGLHPTLQLRIASNGPPRRDDAGDAAASGASCKLHAYFTLPRHVFADRYQLGDPLFLASKNLTALHHISQPVDLEAPDYAVGAWGSVLLLELAPPSLPLSVPSSSSLWTAELPLHLRYLRPADGGYRDVDVPWPAVFWACAAEEGTKFATNPFDQVNLGYDGLFGPRTEFWHLRPDAVAAGTLQARLASTIRVPVLDSSRAHWVNSGTAVAVLGGFLWVLWKLWNVYRVAGYGRLSKAPPSKAAADNKKKR